METQDFTTTITVNATAPDVFEKINEVEKWWTENLEGNTKKLDDEFTVSFGDVHMSKQKLVEVIPGKKVVWLVTDSKLNFVADTEEWINTRISFEVDKFHNQTRVKFTHSGLTPSVECYNACTNAWTYYINDSLFKLLTTGTGTPEVKVN
jgi:hypothetical protein